MGEKKTGVGNSATDSKQVAYKIALVSAPWPLFGSPSIQLGALKAYLKKQMPDLEIVANHFFLKMAESIGYGVYESLSKRTWLAETVYGALLYPERFDGIEKLFKKSARGKRILEKTDFAELVRKVEQTTEDFVSEIDWSVFGLVGFSVCICQLTSSLFLMEKIKKRRPESFVVAGGSLLCAGSAKKTLGFFRQMDAIVVGEGEQPLAFLVENLRKGIPLEKISPSRGIVTRGSDETAPAFWQVSELGKLPPPDLDEYFELLDTFPPKKKFFPMLPAEISRGCWHRLGKGANGARGCAFCNLNLQWKGYRTKKTEQAISEIENTTSARKLLSVSFMDNALPPKQTAPVFKALPSLKKDLNLFCEIRATVGEDLLKILRRAGVAEVQIGIEALSTGLLEKINKGTTAIQNLEIMKNCEALSIANNSNLMLRFPGSDETDADQTLYAITFAEVFRPLRVVDFWLGLDSPVYLNYKAYGLKAVFNHPNYRVLFPKEIVDSVEFTIQDYKGGKERQGKIWRPVERAVENWRRNYGKLHEKPGEGPILSYRDGRDFMIVRRRRIGMETENHRLTGTSREIYLFCGHARSVGEMVENFQGLAEDKLRGFLNMMVGKKLMFGEGDKYLSLAVPAWPIPLFR